MSACEKCWYDAYNAGKVEGGSQAERYFYLLAKRQDNPCSPREQAGQFWDEEKQCDKRAYYDG